jgi:hypothetical protein
MDEFPIDTCPRAVLPLLIEAKARLHRLGAPQAGAIADRISVALENLIDVAADVEAYGNKWGGGRMGELAEEIRLATRSWYGLGS